MREANSEDLGRINEIAEICGLCEVTPEMFASSFVYIGESGYVIVDSMDLATGIPHIAILPSGRGRWAIGFVKMFTRWIFTATSTERLIATIPAGNDNIVLFCKWCGFVETAKSPRFTYLQMDMLSWFNTYEYSEHGDAPYEYADVCMEENVNGACVLMRRNGLDEKAWYIYTLYAKLFGYKVEV